MTTERWQQVKEVFQQALAVEPQARESYLHGACGEDHELAAEVLSLLEASAEDVDILDTPNHLPSLAPVVARVKEEYQRGDKLIGRVIGNYRIQSLIGEGGMGSVYLAVREDAEFRMQVAIKVLNHTSSGLETVDRFRLERQILARLNHPFIARIFDGGVTEDGLLYFVMEYIEGIPLDEYLRRKQPSLEARLQLFREICSAVSFAHQNLVVHSDIKMGNILIMDGGIPKLLDFGISRLLDAEGKERDFNLGEHDKPTALTPAYASPEQLRGDQLTTASDIYSLGVLLYEMVCGRRPYEPDPGNPLGILAKIASARPPRPSEITSLAGVQQDLDAIILKSIQMRPENRFITANQFAQDVARYLNHQPVSACPDTAFYHSRKFLRRNRVAVAVGLLAAASLLGGVVASSLLAKRAEMERQRAEARFQDVRQLASSLIFDLDADLAKLPGATGVRGKLVERALEYLDRLSNESSGDPQLQRELAAAYERLGDVQGRPNVANIGNSALALECYRKALSIREALASTGTPSADIKADIAQTYQRLSSLQKLMGDYRMGLQYDRDALRMNQEMLALDPDNMEFRRKVASSYTALGSGLSQVADWDGALESRRQALRMFEEIVAAGSQDPEDKRGLCLAHRRLGGILLMKKDAREAEYHFRKALSLSQEMIRENASDARNLNDVAASAMSLGGLLYDNGQYQEAMERYSQAIRIHEDLAAIDPLDARNRSLLASTIYRLARTMIAAGNPSAALPLVRRTLEMREQLARENPMNAGAQGEVGESHMLIGDCHRAMASRDRALSSYRRAMAIFRQLQMEGKENAILEIHRRETLEKIHLLERS
jgi:non-specific serine/threonine protein kinase/serine/threonine-protein kinase